MSKDRVTVLVAANMSGTKKKKLLIIGKSQKPRCFSSVKQLPVDYANNRKAWMTSDLFEKWLRFIESHDCLEHEFDEEDDIPLSLWSQNLNSDSIAAPEMWEDYVDIDSALLTFEEPTDENIIQNINAKEQLESDGKEEVEEAPLPTAEEALKAEAFLI
ncbi:uncharacterized protein [Atheta coriaria]|uniref:uncharacterized protein n=1 Tax=Dalotia coriaria TaxID=877792 RepID=UPI0031F40A00